MKNESFEAASIFKVYGVMSVSSLILSKTYSSLPNQKKASDSARTAFGIIERTSKIDSMSLLGLRPTKFFGKIEFKNVFFEYPTRPQVKILQNFNLLINNGETNALVGQSGSGKSTVIGLLLRFYDVTGGSVELDGVDIRRLNIGWLRSKIGIVSQEPALFDYSIRENILNGDLNKIEVNLLAILLIFNEKY